MAKSLDELCTLCGGRVEAGYTRTNPGSARVQSIGINAQAVNSRGLFAAVPGTRTHGATWAKNSPAMAILTDEEGYKILHEAKEQRPVMVVEDVRAILGIASAAIYNKPSSKLTVIGVTGTAGKTTVSYFLEAGLMACGYKTGIIGTTGTRIDGKPVPTELTTPEAPVLQELFAEMLEQKVTHVVMEVSSHALMLGRVSGIDFDVAGFTNLSQDHLDFHKSMEEYFEAKASFFRCGSPLKATTSVICVDDDWGQKMAILAGPAAKTVTTTSRPASVRVDGIEVDKQGYNRAVVHIGPRNIDIKVGLPGRFNVSNAALAVVLATAAGADAAAFAAALSTVVVPGRMEPVDEGQNFAALVDYAHKPAAVSAVLDTLRDQTPGRIGIVLGAGGDRDHGKREIMGAYAAQRTQLLIVTDDNPRSEDPAAIRAAIIAGARSGIAESSKEKKPKKDAPRSGGAKVRHAEIRDIGDRREAIFAAVDWAEEGDVIVIAGKGHETGQRVGDKTHPFNDREVLRAALQAKVAAQKAPEQAQSPSTDSPQDTTDSLEQELARQQSQPAAQHLRKASDQAEQQGGFLAYEKAKHTQSSAPETAPASAATTANSTTATGITHTSDCVAQQASSDSQPADEQDPAAHNPDVGG